jgi:diamine N-acetyltransferase
VHLLAAVMIHIADASESSIPLIQKLAEQTWWPSYGPILEKDQIEYMLDTIYSAETMNEAMKSGSQRFLILYENEEPMAFASYGKWDDDITVWKIFKLYVLPQCHGKGFGKKLIDEICSRANAKGVKTIVLNVNRNNPAVQFYRKTGFVVLREEDIPIGPYWMNDYVMKRSI